MAEDFDTIERIPHEMLVQGGLMGEDYDPTLGKAPLSNAERQARFVARRGDIGELPPVADPERVERCRRSLVEFGVTYCLGGSTALLKRPPSPRMRAYAEELQRAIEGTGMLHIRFPRGAGKTTWIKIAIAWAVTYGLLKFVVVVGATSEHAEGIIADIWALFEHCDLYAADFPAVSHPIRRAEGLQQRFAAQKYRGKATRMSKDATEFRLPIIEGAPSSGAIVKGRGASGAVRGLAIGAQRPDFVLLDDLQTADAAKSQTKLKKLAKLIQKDVLGLGGERMLNVVMTSTPIEPGDLSEQFADESLHPEFRNVSFPLVQSWPKAEALWERYDELWRAAKREGDPEFRAATAFYEANREEMDEGGDVLDPGAFDERLERSGIQHARNLLLAQGRAAFNAEYQLSVHRDDDVVPVTQKIVSGRVNGWPRGRLPAGTNKLVGFLDVNAVRGVTWAVTAFGRGDVAAVVDYGRHPGNGRRLVPEGATEKEEKTCIARAVTDVVRTLLGRRYLDETGAEKRVEAVWIDDGYQTKVVRTVAAVLLHQGHQNVYTMKGVDHFSYRNDGRHVVGVPKEFVDFRQAEADEWFMADADHWKETAQRAFLGEALQPGSASLWGSDPLEHWDFAGEVTVEQLVSKSADRPGGRERYRWSLPPGADNHYLDAVSGCFAMASWYNLLDDAAPVRSAFRRVAGASAPVAVAASPSAPRRAALRRRHARSAFAATI